MTQHFVGYPNGTNGGAFIWERSPIDSDERALLVEAVAVAAAHLGIDGSRVPPSEEEVLSSVDEKTRQLVLAEWIKEAEDELERRKRFLIGD